MYSWQRFSPVLWPASQKINDPKKKWANKLNRHFSKEEVEMAKIYMKKCSTSLAIKEMQVKITLRFHLTHVRMVIIKNISNKCWRGCGGKRNPHALLVEM
jgi:hypothetical protein